MRRLLALAVAIPAVAAASSAARADDIRVPGDVRSLQEALDAARPGDTVLLGRGTYRGPFEVGTEGVSLVAEEGTRILGTGRRIEDGRIDPALVVRADGFAVRGVSFQRGGIRIEGNDASVDRCGFRRIATRRGSAEGVFAMGEGISVTDSEFLFGGRQPRNFRGVWIDGPDATISGNVFEGCPFSAPVEMDGDGALLEGNTIRMPGGNGITVDGDGGMVSGNRMEGALLYLVGDGNAAIGNESSGVPLGLPSVLVEGDGNLLEDNDARFGGDSGIVVRGDGNVLRRNTVAWNGTVRDGMRLGHGIVVRGPRNRVESCSVESCAGEGIRVVGNNVGDWFWDGDSWTRPEGGADTGNAVVDSTATGAGTCGLGNWTLGTDVTGSGFTGNGVDVVDGGAFDEFEDNDYATGGPGFTGTGNGGLAPDWGVPETDLGFGGLGD